jgi:hypothetical protein
MRDPNEPGKLAVASFLALMVILWPWRGSAESPGRYSYGDNGAGFNRTNGLRTMLCGPVTRTSITQPKARGFDRSRASKMKQAANRITCAALEGPAPASLQRPAKKIRET